MPTGDISICVEEASAFLSVAKSLNENQDLVGLTPEIYPLAVNAAFSCELSLKALAMARSEDGTCPRTHELKTLFENLEQQDQDELESRCETALNIGFSDALDEFNNAFNDWRYAHEEGVGIHYEELLKFAEVFLNYAKEVTGQQPPTVTS